MKLSGSLDLPKKQKNNVLRFSFVCFVPLLGILNIKICRIRKDELGERLNKTVGRRGTDRR